MNAPAIFYGERPPSAATAPWVLSYWTFRAEVIPPAGDPYIVWPDGCANIGLVRAPSGHRMLISTGPRLTSMQPPLRPQHQLWGVRLWPDVIEQVLGVLPASLRDHVGPAPLPIAQRFAALDAALPASDDPDLVLGAFDGWMQGFLAAAPSPDPRIRTALRAIVAARGEVAMADVAREAGIGLRHLQRRFPLATGLTLREWARIRRLREAIALRLAPRDRNWSRIAASTGFVDHAHLTREFVALTGLAPTEAGRLLDGTAHDRVTP